MTKVTEKLAKVLADYHAMSEKDRKNTFALPTMMGEVDVTPLSDNELDNLDDAWEVLNYRDDEIDRRTIYRDDDKLWLELVIMAQKARLTSNNYFYGLKSPSAGIVVREPICEDLVGATTTNWGVVNWATAGFRNWLGSLAIDGDTLAVATNIILKDSEDDIWSWIWLGNVSYHDSPKIKSSLMYLDQNPYSTHQIRKQQIRSAKGVARHDSPYLITTQPFKVGLEVTTGYTGNDFQVPMGWVAISTKRSRDQTPNRPSGSA